MTNTDNSIWGAYFDDIARALGHKDAAAYVEAHHLDLYPVLDNEELDSGACELMWHMERECAAAGIDIDEL